MNILDQLYKEKMMAMIRGIQPEAADRTVEALAKGGIRLIEVTTNTTDAYKMVERWRKAYGDDVLFGVGTVLDAEMAKQAMSAGARFIVSPNLDEEVIAYGSQHHIDVFPGVMTPTEIVKAIRAGARAVKVFPVSSLGGAAYLKEIRAPLDRIPMIASGGVGPHNLKEIIAAGAAAAGIGGHLVVRKWVESGNYAAIEQRARELVELVAGSQDEAE